jgi:hypothetical protein
MVVKIFFRQAGSAQQIIGRYVADGPRARRALTISKCGHRGKPKRR